MSAPQHTPGAMRAAVSIMGDDEFIFTSHGRKNVAGLAALIDDQTSAPELLAALEMAVATIERYATLGGFNSHKGTTDVAQSAIAKAKGAQ